MKNCPNCKKDFAPNSGKQKFCSDKCKVAFARKTAKGIEGVKAAKEVPPPENKKEEKIEKESWMIEIEDYCAQEGILPADLINAHKMSKSVSTVKESGKKSTFHDFTQDKAYGKPYSAMDNPLFKAKMGLK